MRDNLRQIVVSFINTIFRDNRATSCNGGAVHAPDFAVFTHSVFRNNSAGNDDGAIHVTTGPRFHLMSVYDNTAVANGGAGFLMTRTSFLDNGPDIGAAVYSIGDSVTFENLTLAHNVTRNADALWTSATDADLWNVIVLNSRNENSARVRDCFVTGSVTTRWTYVQDGSCSETFTGVQGVASYLLGGDLAFYQVWEQYGLASSVQFQRVDGGGIGDMAVINLGLIGAVDVRGYVDQGVQVGFPQEGNIIFLDAAYSPRMVNKPSDVFVTSEGYACVSTKRAGAIALSKHPLWFQWRADTSALQLSLHLRPAHECQIGLVRTVSSIRAHADCLRSRYRS